MCILSLFIPVIVVSLYFKIEFSYLISLTCSLAAATFIHAQQSLGNILFVIIIFNLTPWACYRFRSNFGLTQLALEREKQTQKNNYELALKEHSLIRQSNLRLSTEIAQIVELYKVTKDMSEVLEFAEIFTILGKKFKESFQFKKCRLILVDENQATLDIKQVFELEYGQAGVQRGEPDEQDEQMLKYSLRTQKIIHIEQKALALAPLVAESKFLGLLAVEGITAAAVDNFSILFNQFSLEFKRVKLYQRIQELAITDGLTGVFVRRYFLQRLEEELARCARQNLKLSFLMIDIDHFKQCNDSFGHLTGDLVLREVAAEIKDCVREIDLVARYGGEEFAVLLPDTDKQGATFVAERIRSSVAARKLSAYDEQITVSVSAGVAGYPEDTTKLKELIDKSDQALYRAKQEGRNKVCLA